jgi:DtxR family Mn-dependent transcriptional regulator
LSQIAPRGKRVEDYLEAIYVMMKKGEKPGVRSLARRLGVKPSSVLEYLRRMDAEGYIRYMRGGRIILTEKGLEIAEKTYERHRIICDFLRELGVPPEIAELDACYIEHGIHVETLNKIIEFLKKCKG